MTIFLNCEDYHEIMNDEALCTYDTPEDSSRFAATWKYPQQLGEGWLREFDLREGLSLAIADYQLHDDLSLIVPDHPDGLKYVFTLSGSWRDKCSASNPGDYVLCGSGMARREQMELKAHQQVVRVDFVPELLYSFVSNSSGQLPTEFQHLIRQPDQEYAVHTGRITAAMQIAIQQMLQCRYQGMTQNMYLDSKIWELLALLLEDVTAQDDSDQPGKLKPEDVERVHYARELLLTQLNNPPSLMELARQLGLNDFKLKRGFRQVFGTTVFGYLHQHRLEQARELLEMENLNVTEVARQVGFADRSYFAAAFRKKFGMNPSVYQRQRRGTSGKN